MTTTYSVITDEGTLGSGLTLAEAGRAMLTYDGHDYDVRRTAENDGWELWVTPSHNSGAPMVPAYEYSFADDEAAATTQMLEKMALRLRDGRPFCLVEDDADVDA